MTTLLEINGIECHAYHGCLPEETITGGRFSVDVIIESDLRKAMESDDLNDTADYGKIHDIVRSEMAIASKLIEHVGGRILSRLHVEFTAKNITVRIRKYNPPVNGQINYAMFEVSGS